jgi:hypothetical protein
MRTAFIFNFIADKVSVKHVSLGDGGDGDRGLLTCFYVVVPVERNKGGVFENSGQARVLGERELRNSRPQ